MKKAFLTILIIFCSCRDDGMINGTWKGAYKLLNIDGNQSHESLNTIIKIENNRFHNEILGLKNSKGLDSFEFFISGGSIIPRDNKHMGFNIESLSKDSLVLSIPQMEEIKLVYRKLYDKVKKVKWKPQGKSYRFQGNHGTAYAEYLNDSIMIEYDETHQHISLNKWWTENFGNYTFLMVKNQLHTFPLLIDSTSSKNVYLTSLEDKIRNYNYQLQTKPEPIDLIGIWRLKDKSSSTLPKMLPDFISKNEIEKLIIEKDSLELKFRDSETLTKYNWAASALNKLIFLKGEKPQVLKILNLKDDELEIEIESNGNKNRLSYYRE